MHFTVVLIALVLDRFRPVAPVAVMFVTLRRWLVALARGTDAGEAQNAWLAAAIVLIPLLALTVLVRALLGPFALLFDLLVLLLVARIAELLQWAERVARALDEGDAMAAASAMQEAPVAAMAVPKSPIAQGRFAIEALILAVHTRLFAPVFWYVLLPGCLGPVLYLLVERLRDAWSGDAVSPAYASRAARLMRWLDWLPARITALVLAVVGNFEDAIESWRSRAKTWTVEEQGVVLASASGALGIELGDPLRVTPEPRQASESAGQAPDDLRSASGLIWRAIVVMMVGLFLLGIGRMVG